MKRLEKVKPGGRGLAYVLPDGPWHYPMQASLYPHHDEFLGTAIDADEWATDSSVGTGAPAAISFAASFVTLPTSTATAGTVTQRLRSAYTSNANIYTVPFRATFAARVATTAGAGVAATGAGNLQVMLGVRDTGATHIAQFLLDFTTAGSSSLAAPNVELQVRSGSTGAGFIASAVHNPFSTTIPRTATTITGYVVEVTHRGTWFGLKEDMQSQEPARLLSFFANPVPRIDLNYFLDARIVADGTAGFTQTAPVVLELDSIDVEQYAYQAERGIAGIANKAGDVRATLLAAPLASNTTGLVTSGAGIFLGFSAMSTATGALAANGFAAFYDASAGGSVVYDFAAAVSAPAQLLWMQQIGFVGTTATQVAPVNFPKDGIPFFKGLIGANVTFAATATQTNVMNLAVVWRGQ